MSNSNGSVSVINTDPTIGATYNTVVKTISVGSSPTSVQITRDGSLAAHYEHTIVITRDKPVILTAA